MAEALVIELAQCVEGCWVTEQGPKKPLGSEMVMGDFEKVIVGPQTIMN